jgi:hypothetical protein
LAIKVHCISHQDKSRNASEIKRAFTGKIFRLLAMLIDKILGKMSLSDNLKEALTKVARPEQ